MITDELIEEACSIHMTRAKELGQLAEGFLGRTEIRVLLWLSIQEEAYATDIMEYFGLSAGRVSNLLKTLEGKGYLQRKRITDDRRRMKIELTQKGKTCAEALDENLHKVFASFFNVLGEEDARRFVSFELRVLDLIRNGDIVLAPPARI